MTVATGSLARHGVLVTRGHAIEALARADRFVFEGFLPTKPGRRLNRLAALRDFEMTVVLYESPHRLGKTLEAIRQVFGDVEMVVARELTKQFEEILAGPVSTPEASRSVQIAAKRIRQ